MTFAINMVDATGKEVRLLGEALPLHEELPPPAAFTLELSADDLARIQKGYSRLLRAARAYEGVGHFSLNFAHGVGFTVDNVPSDAAVKLFALECRPFFLEKDPLAFSRLLNLPSLSKAVELRPWLKRLRQRWESSAFGGVVSIKVGGVTLDTHHVVQTWFNCDIFHSEPQKPEEFSLDQLHKHMGGEDQAIAILAQHLWASCGVLSGYFEGLAQMSATFMDWALSEKARLANLGTR